MTTTKRDYKGLINKTTILLIAVCIGTYYASCTTEDKEQLMAGAAQVNITPPIGSAINGGFLPLLVKEIHDSLFAKAVALQRGGNTFVIVEVDVMSMGKSLGDEIKAHIQSETGLQPSQLMISATHAHSCGAVINELFCQADWAYRKEMPAKISEAVKQAIKNLKPAKAAWGSFDMPQHVRNRRWFMKPGFNLTNPFGGTDSVRMYPPVGSTFLDRPAGITDPEVSYLALKGIDGKWIAVVSNYSMHYVGDFPGNIISADYFGVVGNMLKEKLKAGNEFVGVLANGTSGDANCVDYLNNLNYPTEDYAKSRLIANDLTDGILQQLQKAEWDHNPVLNYAYQEIPIAVRKPDKTELETAYRTFLSTDYSSIREADWASKEMFAIYSFEQVMLSQMPDTMQLPVQAVRVGNGCIGSLPGEIFASTGLELKALAPFKNYFTIGLSNGDVGYIPPPEEFLRGGYETWRARSSCLHKQAIPQLKKGLLEVMSAAGQ